MADKIAWTTTTVRLGDLIPWEDNPRQMTEAQAERLQKSIDKYGYSQLLEIDADGMYVDGHQRDALFKAVKELGFLPNTNIEVRRASVPFTIEMRKEYMAWKHEGAAGEWNWEMMPNLFDLDELKEFGIENINFDFFEEEEPPEDPGAQVDKAEELRDKWRVESGQLWQLGEHRLICGDCTDAEVVEKVMGKDNYSVLADPPYNIGFNYDQIADKMSPSDYSEFCNKWYQAVCSNAVGSIITPGPKNRRLYPEPRDIGIWIKRNATAGASVFHLRLAEPVYFYGKFKAKRNFDVFDYSTGFPDELTAARCAAGVEDKHPPAKAIDLWCDLMGMLVSDVVLDPFIGNGTSVIAAEKISRKCRAIEISPAYCAVTLERWSQMTGDTPVLVEAD